MLLYLGFITSMGDLIWMVYRMLLMFLLSSLSVRKGTLSSPRRSLCERACTEKEAVKPWRASFLPSDTFLFGRCFFIPLSRRQRQRQEEADGEGHLNKPSVKAASQFQPDLWLSTPLFPQRGPSLELLDVSDLVYSFLSLLSSSTSFPLLSHLSFFMSIYLFSFFFSLGISFSPSFSPRHPGQLFVQTWCLQLSVQSSVAPPDAGRKPAAWSSSPTPLSPLFAASMTSTWPWQHNYMFARLPVLYSWRGSAVESVLNKNSAMHGFRQKHNIL